MSFFLAKKKNKRKKYVGHDVVFDAENILRLKSGEWHIHLSRKKLFRFFKKHLVSTVITSLLVLLVVFGLARAVLTRADTSIFYASTCLGGWQNSSLAEGKPQVKNIANDFTMGNSAVLNNSMAQIFCGDFKGDVVKDTDLQKIVLHFSWKETDEQPIVQNPVTITSNNFASSTNQIINIPSNTPSLFILTDSASSTFISGEASTTKYTATPISTSSPTTIPVHASATASTTTESIFAPILSPSAPSGVNFVASTTPINNPTPPASAPVPVVNPAPIPTPSPLSPPPTPTTSPSDTSTTTQQNKSTSFLDLITPHVFAEGRLDVISTTTGTTTGVILATTTVGENISSDVKATDEAFLEVVYTIDGTNWHSLGKVSRTSFNGATFELPLSDFSTWQDLSKVQISVQTVPTVSKAPIVYLDSMWLEIEYKNSKPITPKLSEDPARIHVVHIQNTTTDFVSSVILDDNNEEQLRMTSTSSLKGLAIFNASTTALVLNTFVAEENNYIVSSSYFEAGDFVAIETGDIYMCKNKTLEQCRRDKNYIGETTFTVLPTTPAL